MLVGVTAGLPFAAQAQVYKCAQANGTVTYQGTPCTIAGSPPARPTAAMLNAQRSSAPAGSKAYDDPYASSLSSRPHLDAPLAQKSQAPAAGEPKSNAVADVQARNAREAQSQAAQQAHSHDQTLARQLNCQTAIRSVDALRQQRPVYTLDSKAERHYVEDADRQKALAEAQQQMASSCN